MQGKTGEPQPFTALSEISEDLGRLAGDVSLLGAVLCGWVPALSAEVSGCLACHTA